MDPSPGTSPWTTTQVEHDGLVFDVRLAGPEDGTPVLLLHGFPQTSLSWTAVAEQLRTSGLRLVAPDQRGYSPGARPQDVAAYATPALVDDARAVAAALGHDSFHLVGHDWGGSLAWVLAARHPASVRSLVAVSTPHLAAYGQALASDPDQQARSAYLRDVRRPSPGPEQVLLADDAAWIRRAYAGAVAPGHVEAYLDLLRGGALTPALDWYRAMGRDLGSLGAVEAPTTYVWSDDDAYFGRVAALGTAARVRGDYRFVELAGVSHWIPDQAPEMVAQAIQERVSSARR